MPLTHSDMIQAVKTLRRKGIILQGMPVAISFKDNWYIPSRFYWRGEDTTELEMMYGPTPDNDF